MKDTKLFDYIQNLIRQSHGSRPTQPLSFAERYCQQQMMKKKLNVSNRGEKMEYLMRNFRGLQTYVDLPQLIEAVKRWRFEQIQQQKQNKNGSNLLKTQQKQSKMTSFCKSKKVDPNIGEKIKKQLGQKMKQKYINENSIADQLLSSLEKTTTINSAGLKNNSASNINMLYQKVSQQGEDKTWRGGMEFLAKLNESQSILMGSKNEMKKLGQWLEINKEENQGHEGEMNMKLRKEYTKLLHKITTYIQIVLEMQHRRKWQAKNQQIAQNDQGVKKLHKTLVLNRNQSDTNFNKGNTLEKDQLRYTQNNKFTPVNVSLNKKKENIRLRTLVNNNSKQLSRFKSNHQENENDDKFDKTILTNSSLVLSGQLQKNAQNKKITKLKKQPVFLHRKQFSQVSHQQNTQNGNLDNSEIDIRCTIASMRTHTLNSTRSKQNTNATLNVKNESFLRRTSSSNLREQAIRKRRVDFMSLNKRASNSRISITNTSLKSQSNLRQTFTFRHRNVKQKIINRLGSFIREIDQQELNNKKQNHYYTKAINKLQNTLGLCFGRFRQEDLAGDRDIQVVKNYAKVFVSGKSGLSSKFISFDNDLYGGDDMGNGESITSNYNF